MKTQSSVAMSMVLEGRAIRVNPVDDRAGGVANSVALVQTMSNVPSYNRGGMPRGTSGHCVNSFSVSRLTLEECHLYTAL